MGEFTPGPWLIMRQTVYALDETGTTNRFSCRPESGWEVNGRNYTKPSELEANAALIAAAPELLERCEGMIPANVCLTNPNVPDDTIIPLDVTVGELRKIAAAIRKARTTNGGNNG